MATHPERKYPAHGVITLPHQPTVVYLTVCSRQRSPWLAHPAVHECLRKIWLHADAWRVGAYVLMPDHLHLFATPGWHEYSLDRWVWYWKRQCSLLMADRTYQWQRNHWDTRIRSSSDYTQKWEYMRHNPVRAGLVQSPEAWPHQGTLHEFVWLET